MEAAEPWDSSACPVSAVGIAAMAEVAGTRELAAVAVSAWGAVALVLLVGTTEFHRQTNGQWDVTVHRIDNSALTELAKFGTELLKKTRG